LHDRFDAIDLFQHELQVFTMTFQKTCLLDLDSQELEPAFQGGERVSQVVRELFGKPPQTHQALRALTRRLGRTSEFTKRERAHE
jgi:hypothetical protein